MPFDEAMYTNNQGKITSQTSDSMSRWKSRGGKSQRRERLKQENPGARKGIVAKHCSFLCFFAKAAGAEPSGEMKAEQLHLWHKTHFQVKMSKTPHARSRFAQIILRQAQHFV